MQRSNPSLVYKIVGFKAVTVHHALYDKTDNIVGRTPHFLPDCVV